ncbi:MAG: hypothetical protein P9L97_01860 [Candidatus Tenebribacter davisii]|nr:hypothetical protein [Candidatus Tenebribacter davisii]
MKRNYNLFENLGKQKTISTSWLWVILMYSIIFILVSCAASRPPSFTMNYNIPPVILQEKIKTILDDPSLNLNVISAYEGRIETEFEDYPGEVHGYLWFKKIWQERIKYIIIIKQSWGNSQNSEVTIYTEIEHRLNDRFEWERKKTNNKNNKISEIFQNIDRIDK